MDRLLRLSLIFFLASGLTGCVTMAPAWLAKGPSPAPAPVHQVASTWKSHVVTTPDQVNQGAPLTGLTGRIYLFGADLGTPVPGQGQVIVDLYDADKKTVDGKTLMLERWVLDRDTLDRLFRKDTIGWGYTVFLPWATYRPEIKHIEMQVCYVPDKGPPMFAARTPVTLRPEDAQPMIDNQYVPIRK